MNMKRGQVLADSLNLRDAPSQQAVILRVLSKGTLVSIEESLSAEPYPFNGEQKTLWHRIKSGGEAGYVAAAYIVEAALRREFRGVWIPDVTFLDVLASTDNIKDSLDFLQHLGFNAVFPAVWNRGYTSYPSEVMVRNGFAQHDPLYKGFDSLGAIVTEGKRRGIAVIPWFEYGFASSMDADGGPLLRERPSWAAMDRSGKLNQHGDLIWMNSLHPEVQQFLLDLVVEVISVYDVDGIQGDDRWPAMPITAGYDPLSRELYRNSMGEEPPSQEKDSTWVTFRADQMTKYLGSVRNAVKRAKPSCIVTMAPAPYPFGLRELMQDSDRWMRDGLVDLLLPQLYRSDFNSYRRDLDTIVTGWSTSLRSRLAPGIALRANQIDLSESAVLAMVNRNRELGLAGQAFFQYGGLRAANSAVAEALNQNTVYGEAAELPTPFALT
jgi:uncharacterized lipoprotein YddW (UPF0748 family)